MGQIYLGQNEKNTKKLNLFLQKKKPTHKKF